MNDCLIYLASWVAVYIKTFNSVKVFLSQTTHWKFRSRSNLQFLRRNQLKIIYYYCGIIDICQMILTLPNPWSHNIFSRRFFYLGRLSAKALSETNPCFWRKLSTSTGHYDVRWSAYPDHLPMTSRPTVICAPFWAGVALRLPNGMLYWYLYTPPSIP